MGLIFSSAISTGTSGVQREDAGVASATVNTMQQIGGSIGTALLSTIYAGSVRRYAAANAGTQDVQAYAVLHGYHVAFIISSAVLFAVALAGGLIIHRKSTARPRATPTDHEPVPVAARLRPPESATPGTCSPTGLESRSGVRGQPRRSLRATRPWTRSAARSSRLRSMLYAWARSTLSASRVRSSRAPITIPIATQTSWRRPDAARYIRAGLG